MSGKTASYWQSKFMLAADGRQIKRRITMKRFQLSFILALALMLCSSAFAQQSYTFRNVVFGDPNVSFTQLLGINWSRASRSPPFHCWRSRVTSCRSGITDSLH